ncbi:MAG: hypothetical protein GXX85_13045 [Ignavibacteria bacterium]|nr:hypothetical protein [Ignavibacteria bacterium]
MTNYKEIALKYKSKMNLNVLPLKGKRPIINWDKWQNEIQTEKDIEKMDWNNVSGIGGIQGINGWRCIDLDYVENVEIIDLILKELGLPEKYCWVVQSGSGMGYHIYFRCAQPYPSINGDNSLLKLGGEKAVYKLMLKKDGYCKHLELRWMNCQTLPPSLHDSGGIYSFLYDKPKDPPNYVDTKKVVECLEKICVNKPQRAESEAQSDKNKAKTLQTEKVQFDKEKLESALDFLSTNLPDGSYEEWYKIGFALVPLGKQGEKYFVEMSMKNPKYKDSETELKKKFAGLIKDYDGRVTIGTIYHIAEIYGWKKPIIKFWYWEKEKLKIYPVKFKIFLESEGFCKYRIETSHLFIRIENNIIEEIDSVDIKEYVLKYIRNTPIEEFEGTNRNEIINALIKTSAQLFTPQFLEFLDTKDIELNKDTAMKGYFYFKNGYVEIDNSSVNFYSYDKLDKCIWKKQIIDRNYADCTAHSDFEDFLFNVCRSDKKRFEALKTGIGYLLHTYKDPSNSKAVVFIDEKLSDGACGRSGKGLVIKSISKLRNFVREDGRNFNPSKNFAFQRVKADTNILGFDDIREKFPFERLFSIITDGITIERKNKDEIHLSYNESPKIVLSTNFTITGIDDSTLDRQFIIEFSDYYNKDHRPVDDFGKLFFDSWNNEEWSSFDNFMISCLQLFLQKGLLDYDHINLEKKSLIDNTCAEFVEFAEAGGIVPGKEYEKKELYEAFKKEYEDFEKLTQSKFTRWLKVWAKVKGLEVREGKSGSKRTIGVGEKIKAG